MSVFAATDTGLFFFIGTLSIVVLMLCISFFFWRKKTGGGMPGVNQSQQAGFHPGRIHLRGTHGEVLREKVKVDGPKGVLFATYIEEPWMVAIPSTGMMPCEIEVVAYTKHAPASKKLSSNVRLLPVDGETGASQLAVEVRLKKPRDLPVETRY
jgi:hypothetical protein